MQSDRTRWAMLLLFGVLLGPSVPAMENAQTDGNGRITELHGNGESMELVSELRLALPRWSRFASQAPWHTTEVKFSESGGRKEWSGRIRIEDRRYGRYRQTLWESNDVTFLDLQVTAETNLDLEGVFLFLTIPTPVMAGGICELSSNENAIAAAALPASTPADQEPRFLQAIADRMLWVDPSGTYRLELNFDRPRQLTVQDDRAWNSPTYSLFTRMTTGPLRTNETAALRLRLRLMAREDHAPVRLVVDTQRTRYQYEGGGGNFVYGLESPVTQYALDQLRLAWARTALNLAEWEPENDNASPSNINWSALGRSDRPGSNLQREFLLSRQLAQRRIPTCASIWRLPEWMYTDPGKGREAQGRRIADGSWPEVLESIGSYLQYAKRQYGFEPELLSFNEASEGVNVALTATEQRDAIRRIGAHLARLGLKTKLLLGDVGSPRGTTEYVRPALAEPDVMQYVGALAFHSWGGATAREYAAWPELARAARRPLLVTELGVDASAWQTPWIIPSYAYALKELRMIQEVLLYAEPQAILEWELTSDYATAQVTKDRAGKSQCTPGFRFHFLRHFYNLTPHPAIALVTTSDHPKVLLTAFASDIPAQNTPPVTTLSLHIANLGSARPALLTGLPLDIDSLRVMLSNENTGSRRLDPIPVERGQVQLDLPAQSLVTLTTLPVE